METLWGYFWQYAPDVVFICSLLSLFLPAPEEFNDFPRFQKVYRLALKFIVKWGSLDLRSKVLAARGVNLENGKKAL